MKKLFFNLLLLLAIGPVHAADLIQLTQKQAIPADPAMFNQSNSPALKEIKKFNKHTRYQQLIDGIPVYGHHVIYHHDVNQGYYTGHWIKPSPAEKNRLFSSPKKLTADEALVLAKQDFQTTKRSLVNHVYQYRQEQSKLHYYLNDDKQLQKIYLVTFFAEDKQLIHPARPYYLIDANSKNIIKYWDGLTTSSIGTGPGGNEKTGRYEYGMDYPKLDVAMKDDGTTCQMTSNHVDTINLNHLETSGGIYEYVCPYQSSDEINGAYSPMNDAHFFGGVVFAMYQDWYNTIPLAFKLKMQVHYGNDFENAFWDGSSMNFGDGAAIFYPLVALDVAAHEISHGLTEQNSGLEYWGQSGGLNESFSDMAGKAAEYYLHGENKWTIGADITKELRALRDMDRPERDGNSIGDARDFEPSLNVHYTSGVFNRLFYSLATTKGWDTRKTFQVMLAANQHYWEPETNFYQAAEGVLQSTKDAAYNVEDVLNAAKAVGISCVSSDSGYQCEQSPEDNLR